MDSNSHNRFIVKGVLPEADIAMLERDMVLYRSNATQGSFTTVAGNERTGRRYNEDSMKCKTFHPFHNRYPNTTTLLHSLIIENYYSIFDELNYNTISNFQYVRYDKGDFIKKHNDIYQNESDILRLLTMSVNMSNSSDYDGGELVIFNNEGVQIDELGKSKGSFIIIPSFLFHEACVVNFGTREALVAWLTGSMQQNNRFQDVYYARNLERDK